MGFIDLIFDNIVFLIAILAGIMSLFKKSGDNEDAGPVRSERPKPVTYEKSDSKPAKVSIDTISSSSSDEDDEVQIDQTNQWYEQLQESRERREQSKTDKNLDKIKQSSIHNKDRQTVENVSIRRNLNNRRLVESLIMSEVLGKPKAKQNR
ncbi:hypothetical protein [Piscibacillus salipiscarius]|uniref:Uncharacterized protein n=1 Tax=Piscibacillus salipiscarius TaxID=299480 RepID=A0ABW5Q6Q4_9BACI|nr:hypothetical protein [Piscibacillus salipiscarius]